MESLCQLGEIKMETLAGTTAKVCLPDFSGPSVCDVVPTIISTLNSRHPLSRLALERPGVAKLAGLMQPGERRKGVIFFILDSVSAVHLQHILSRENVFASCGKVRSRRHIVYISNHHSGVSALDMGGRAPWAARHLWALLLPTRNRTDNGPDI